MEFTNNVPSTTYPLITPDLRYTAPSSWLMKNEGSVVAILGCMYTNKTSTLLEWMATHIVHWGSRSSLLLKPWIDTRFDTNSELNEIASSGSDTNMQEATIRTHSDTAASGYRVKKLMNMREDRRFLKAEFIFIDEGQFFDDLKPFCLLCSEVGKTCYISALNGDYKQMAFPAITEIIPLCSTIKFLHGLCILCKKKPSTFTILNENITPPTGQVLIGGEEKYQAVCQTCLVSRNQQNRANDRTQRFVSPPPLYANGSARMPPTPGAPIRRTSSRGPTLDTLDTINHSFMFEMEM
jgi:thymidine kinase